MPNTQELLDKWGAEKPGARVLSWKGKPYNAKFFTFLRGGNNTRNSWAES